MKLEKLRAFLLEKGDEFLLFGISYKVIDITENSILYTPMNSNFPGTYNTIGVNSREKIMLICKPHPSGTKVIYI